MYFQKFPDILYTFDIGNTTVLKPVTDITQNVRLRKKILENVLLYDEYDIKEGETPEIIAAKYYGSSGYHWIVMLCNQMYDWRSDWPMPYHTLEQYILDKYQSVENANATHHYIDSSGYTVNSDSPGATPVSNYQYEQDINESKRRIKLINAQLLNAIVNEFTALV